MAYEGSHAGRHAHHRRNFPTREYKDLCKEDLAVFALIFARPPPPEAPGAEAFEDQTEFIIANLPSHLRSKLPRLTTLCSTHKKLNPLPLISLWNSFKYDTEREMHRTWTPLCAENALVGGNAHYVDKLQRYPWNSIYHSCAACSLSSLAYENELLIALGAQTMATLAPKNWARSKRIYFLQCLLAGRANPSYAEGLKQKMLEIGQGYRRLREEMQMVQYTHPPRSAGLRTIGGSPPRPLRSPEQDDHVSLATTVLSKEKERFENEVDFSPTRAEHVSPRKPVPPPAKSNIFDQAFGPTQTADATLRARDASSSVYSSHSRSDEQHAATASTAPSTVMQATGSDILDLYRHSAFPADFPPAPTTASTNHTTQVPRPAPYSRHKLAPIAIPGNSAAVPAGPRTSALWARRASRAPKLRVGKNGEVKGPFDPVSEVSLVQDEHKEQTSAWI